MANSELEQGLFLPLRFYDSLEQQERFKPLSVGVANPYSYVCGDIDRLLPFQIYIPYAYAWNTIDITIICVGTSDTWNATLIENACLGQAGTASSGRIVYKGDTDAGFNDMSEGLYYLKIITSFTGSNELTFYSEVFKLINFAGEQIGDTENYRVYSNEPNSIRASSATDLRIHTT